MHREVELWRHKSPIVIAMPHKGLYFSSILWPWHVHNFFDLFFVRTYAIFGHNVAQNLALSHHEDTFLWVQAEPIHSKLLKYRSKLSQVIHSLSRMNTQVVNIYLQKTSEKILEYVTHEPMKGRGGICQPKWHYFLGKSASFYRKIHLVLIF